MKSAAELKRADRARMRKLGYTLKQVWILPAKWGQIQRYIDRVQGR